MTDTKIGAPVRRKEDYRFLDDMNRRGQCHAVFVRSPHVHETFKIDSAAAR